MKIAVIGGCNVDFVARPKLPVEKGTSNVSNINISAGGVGRNIAENLCRMGAEVTLAATLGDDMLSSFVEKQLKDIGIKSAIIKKHKTGIYMAIIEPGGSLDASFSDMEEIESVTAEEILKAADNFKDCEGAIIDANLNEQAIWELSRFFKESKIPFALETVSNEKCLRVKRSIDGTMLVKPNKYEAELITGYSCKSVEDAPKCAEYIHSMGARNVIISLGKEGFYFYNKDFCGHFPVETMEIVDVTGAGDSIISSAFLGIIKGLKPEIIAEISRKCAALTCKSIESVSKEINSNIFL